MILPPASFTASTHVLIYIITWCRTSPHKKCSWNQTFPFFDRSLTSPQSNSLQVSIRYYISPDSAFIICWLYSFTFKSTLALSRFVASYPVLFIIGIQIISIHFVLNLDLATILCCFAVRRALALCLFHNNGSLLLFRWR